MSPKARESSQTKHLEVTEDSGKELIRMHEEKQRMLEQVEVECRPFSFSYLVFSRDKMLRKCSCEPVVARKEE